MQSAFRLLLLVPCALALGACATQAPSQSKVVVTGPAAISFELAETDSVRLHLPTGEAIVTARDIDYVEAQVEVRCPADSSSCVSVARNLAWSLTRAADSADLRLNRKRAKGMEVTVAVSVPRDRPLQVNMGYGDLRILNHAQNLAVTLKGGAIDIAMPQRAVRDVRLRARFGDAALTVPQASVEGRRPTLVGAKVDWPDGPGRHYVDARVRYGDVQVRLE